MCNRKIQGDCLCSGSSSGHKFHHEWQQISMWTSFWDHPAQEGATRHLPSLPLIPSWYQNRGLPGAAAGDGASSAALTALSVGSVLGGHVGKASQAPLVASWRFLSSWLHLCQLRPLHSSSLGPPFSLQQHFLLLLKYSWRRGLEEAHGARGLPPHPTAGAFPGDPQWLIAVSSEVSTPM